MKKKKVKLMWFLCVATTSLIACASTSREPKLLSSNPNRTSESNLSKSISNEGDGFYPRDEIERPVREHSTKIQSCYEAQLAKSPGLSGRIEVSWVISKDGHVTEISSEGMPELAPCILKIIKTIRFRPPFGTTQTVSKYPFVFLEK